MDYRVGDVRARLAEIPDGTVSLVASSPPFVALRSYLPADHPDKHLEIGSEPDPASFLDTLLALTAEWGRVLAPWGSIAIELGDTYAGSGGAGGDYGPVGLRAGQNAFDGSMARTKSNRPGQYGTDTGPPRRDISSGWPRAKCLALVPQLYAASLAYGRNLLTGQPSPAGQWLVRNMIVWHRPNPAVGALGDKVRPSTSYIVVATRSPKRWFDLTAVRTPYLHPNHPQIGKDATGTKSEHRGNWGTFPTRQEHSAGAPPLDCWFDEHDTWTITTQPSKLAHYAMWPPKLAERLILMMCPLEVCAVCGEPRRRIERNDAPLGARYRLTTKSGGTRAAGTGDKEGSAVATARPTTLGWTSCPCADYRPGVVLDPFCGTGTSLCVAELHGRDSIGIDLDARNRDLVPARMDECRRALFGTQPELPGQLGFDLEVTA